jgi:ATP-dependent exoDNAse (exonuclease V) alpha subunit
MRRAGRLGKDHEIESVEAVFGKPEKMHRLALAKGDRLLFTKNDKRLGVRNGTLGTIEGLDRASLIVRLDSGQRIAVDLDRYRNIAHGYAMTVHKAQGVTVDRTHLLAGKSMDRHMAYVGLSRHRSEATLHYGRDDFASEAGMIAKLSRQRFKDTTLDYRAERSFARAARQAGLSNVVKRPDHARRQEIRWNTRNRDDDFGLER